MPDIVFSGTLSEILAKLRRIKVVIEKRNVEGYPTMQHDETYKYHSYQDGNTCKDCLDLNGSEFRGDYIATDFKFYVSLNYKTVAVHNETSYHKAQQCRCEAEWVNVHEVLVQRVTEEMENA